MARLALAAALGASTVIAGVLWAGRGGAAIPRAPGEPPGALHPGPAGSGRRAISGPSRRDVQVGRDGAGDTVAVWGDATGGPVQSRVRPAGRRWSRVVTLSGRDASAPGVVVSPSGRALAVWQGYDARNDRVVDVSRLARARAAWSRARQLSRPGQDAIGPAAALDGAGDGAVVWSSNPAGGAIEISAQARGHGWSRPRRLSPAGQPAGSPAVSLGRGGRAVVVWRAARGDRVTIQGVSGDATRNHWGRVETLVAGRPGEDLGAPRVGVDARGDAVAIWYRRSASGFRIEESERRAGAAWSGVDRLSRSAGRPHDLARPGPTLNVPAIALSRRGGAVAVWVESRAGTDVVKARVRAPGGAWRRARTLSEPGADAGDPQVAMAPDGRAVAVWEALDGEAFRVEAATLDPHGRWSRARAISVPNADVQRPQVALDRAGRPVIAWVDTDWGVVVADLPGPAVPAAAQ